MKHSFFDKIVLFFLFMSLSVFALLIFYSTRVTRNALIEEKTEVLNNEAFLIGEQSIAGYIQGIFSYEDTKRNLEYYGQTLGASIWYADDKGIIKVYAAAEGHPEAPKNIFLINQDFNLYKSQNLTGDFYGTFEDEVISVCIPIQTNNEPNGMLMIHATVNQLKDVQRNIINAMYVPFLLLLIASLTFLALVSGKIIRPIKKISAVAEEYSTGNFEARLDIKSKDEIGQLAVTLEYMASELSKLDEYRRDFVSNISHDFRSPLTSIKGYIEAIQDGTIPPEKQDKYLGIVLNETKRLSKLTDGLLELNSLNSYGIWIIQTEFDIIPLIKNAINTFEGKCEDRGISLVLNNHCENTKVYADKTKIQQVIYNLLDNAIKFTPNGKSIYITLNEKNDKVFVSVKDEGCGIPADALKKIWVRFYKADSSRGRDKQGTGLGLAITKEIVKAHGENINVVSTEGVGSEFTFSLAHPENKNG